MGKLNGLLNGYLEYEKDPKAKAEFKQVIQAHRLKVLEANRKTAKAKIPPTHENWETAIARLSAPEVTSSSKQLSPVNNQTANSELTNITPAIDTLSAPKLANLPAPNTP